MGVRKESAGVTTGHQKRVLVYAYRGRVFKDSFALAGVFGSFGSGRCMYTTLLTLQSPCYHVRNILRCLMLGSLDAQSVGTSLWLQARGR